MAASFNRVILMGNLTRDPEVRATRNGQSVCNFSMAMNRTYTTQAGEKKDEVCFMNIVVWGKAAENCGQYLKKGRPVLVEGYLQNRSWEAAEGQKRTVTEVVADRVQFLGGGNGNGTAVAQPEEPETAGAGTAEDVPF